MKKCEERLRLGATLGHGETVGPDRPICLVVLQLVQAAPLRIIALEADDPVPL